MADYSGKKHIVSVLMRCYTDRVPITVTFWHPAAKF